MTNEQRERLAEAVDKYRRGRRAPWSELKRRARRMWSRALWWSYWVVAVTLIIALTWKLLTSGDFLLVAVGVAYAIAIGAIGAGVAVGFAVWKFWSEIQHAAERAGKPASDPPAIGAKLEDAPPPERIH